MKAIREAVGPDFHLRIDANAGYDADTSIKLARMVAPLLNTRRMIATAEAAGIRL